MKRVETIYSANEYANIENSNDLQISIIFKYCPDDIVNRDIIFGENFYISSVNILGTSRTLQNFKIYQEVEHRFSNMSKKQMLDTLKTALSNPKPNQIFSPHDFKEHLKILNLHKC